MKAPGVIAFALALFTGYSHPGVGIAMDSRGNVFYTDLKHVCKSIITLAPNGDLWLLESAVVMSVYKARVERITRNGQRFIY